MGKAKMYRVQRFVSNGVWQTVVEDNSKQFCLGWVLGIDSLYPSAPYRVIDEENNVLRQTKGRAAVKPNGKSNAELAS